MTESKTEPIPIQVFAGVYQRLLKVIEREEPRALLLALLSLSDQTGSVLTTRKELSKISGVKHQSINYWLDVLSEQFTLLVHFREGRKKRINIDLAEIQTLVVSVESPMPIYILLSYSLKPYKALDTIDRPIGEKKAVSTRNNYPNWLTPKKDPYESYKHNKPLGSINLENASVYLTLKEVENLLKRFGSGKDSKLRLQFWINQLCEYQAKNPKRFPAKKEKTDFYRTILEWDRRKCADGYEFGYHTHEGRYGFYRSWVFDKLYEESKKSGVSA